MTWPLVWRSTLEYAEGRIEKQAGNIVYFQKEVARAVQEKSESERRLDEARAERIAERDAAERRYADLLARFTMLRMQGAVQVAPPEPVKPVDPVAVAIANASGGDPELRMMMAAQVSQDRMRGKSEADILAAIMIGQSATDGTFI